MRSRRATRPARAEFLTKGFDAERNSFRQHYDTGDVDASLLQLPQIGFIDADDPRMRGTVAALEHDLMVDGLLLRYRTSSGVDGIAGEEHPFLACSFWLVEQYAASGRLPDARVLMDRLTSFVNDVGLLSEQYDPVRRRQMGNTPQALSHLALVRAADAIAAAEKGHAAELANVRGESEAGQAGQRPQPEPPTDEPADLGRTPEESRDRADIEIPTPPSDDPR